MLRRIVLTPGRVLAAGVLLVALATGPGCGDGSAGAPTGQPTPADGEGKTPKATPKRISRTPK
ncbi:MAG: hypothetical protein K2X87_26550 [Gemmataceae bacterium]|nr:hypothetical protein [Gemmataceae bacterium]